VRFDHRGIGDVYVIGLQARNQLIGLVTREPSRGLSLREPQRMARLAYTFVTRASYQLRELLELFR